LSEAKDLCILLAPAIIEARAELQAVKVVKGHGFSRATKGY
jgi:hypothetical protein